MSSPHSPRSFYHSLIREPLLHFVLLGGLVFAADRVVQSRTVDPKVIVVSPEVVEDARSIFRSAQGRDPTSAELKILRERWVDNEVLYREGLALRLEQGDPTLRERIIFKALNVIESNLRVPEVDEATLREWFAQHRDQYDAPARYDFSEAVPSDTTEATARRFAEALNTGAEADVKSGLRIFKGRPRSNVIDAFGAPFVEALDRSPLNQWQVLQGKEGARVIRVESRETGEAVTFEAARPHVLDDWRNAKAQELRTSAIRELGKKYVVRIEGSSS